MAKAKQEVSEAKSKFQEALDKLNKTYGEGTVLALDSKTNGNYDVISSGSIGFDNITLGVGGFVVGRACNMPYIPWLDGKGYWQITDITQKIDDTKWEIDVEVRFRVKF